MATSFSDYSNPYITELYNQKKQAAADALTSAYQQNMAAYNAQAQETKQAYGEKRNQTQAQYEKALKNFGEYSAASGLNSGANAQARLAYGNQNQAGLANLSAGEAAALQDIARDRAGVESQYRSDLAANEAAYDADLYNALYGAWQDQVAQENADRSYYYTLAMNTIQTGNMPDADTLAKAGIDSGTASAMTSYYKAMLAPAATSSGGGGGSSRRPGSSGGGSGDNNDGIHNLLKDGGDDGTPNTSHSPNYFKIYGNAGQMYSRTMAQSNSNQKVADYLAGRVNAGEITQAEAQQILSNIKAGSDNSIKK